MDPGALKRRLRPPRVAEPEERRALGLLERQRYHWPNDVVSALARLTAPIDDVLDHVAPRARWWGRSPTRGALMIAMWRERQAFWGWDRERWVSVLCATDADVRQLVTAVAYLLCDHRDLHREFRGWKCGLFAGRVFGQEPVDEAVARVQQHLDGLGYAAQLRRPNLQCALDELMLKAGSPVLEDLAGRSELIVALRSREQNNARRHGVEQLARTLLDMGVLAALPFGAQPTREDWLARSQAGEREVPAEWLAWAGRWFQTATLARTTRERIYYALIKAGRWLTREHPDRTDPDSWTRELAAAWVAAVDQMLVGELSHARNTNYHRARSGGPLSPRTKAQYIWALRAFFRNLQEWDWIERRFDRVARSSCPGRSGR